MLKIDSIPDVKSYVDGNGVVVPSYDIIGDECYGYRLVRSVDGMYNFIGVDGVLLSSVWFDEACDFVDYSKSQDCPWSRVWIGEDWYNLFTDGTLVSME